MPKYCLENDSVNHYLNDFSYDTIPDYNVSYIINYYNKDASFRSDWPKPVDLSWTNDPDAESQFIEVSEDASFAKSLIYNVGQDKSGYDVYNLIPGRIYYYRVMSVKGSDTTQVDNGAFETTGFLRMLAAEGTLNVRDMGGWKGLGGHQIKYGQLFRGARLKENGSTSAIVTKSGIEALRNAGIRAELDLRSKSNVPSSESALSVKGDVDFLLVPESVNARMYNYDKNDANIREIQWIINELKKGKPVYYHCSMGADRTGTLGFLLGALFGMSDGDLAKDYEITTFCSWYTGENSYSTPFARFRNYTGKWGSPDNSSDPKEYMFAPLIDKLKTVEPVNGTTQRKIYSFLKNGVNGTKISEADLDWLIKEMVDYVIVKDITTDGGTTLDMEPGQTHMLNAVVSPQDATNNTVSYSSSNESVATVSADGIITAVRGGTAQITLQADDMVKTITVNVPLIESVMPDTVIYNNLVYKVVGSNLISNGSFEYGGYFVNWTNALNTDMSESYFDVIKYGDSDSCFIQSKYDGGEESAKSIRSQWKIKKSKTYVFGYRIKNSTDLVTEKNENLVVSLTYYRQKIAGSVDEIVWSAPEAPELVLDFYPSYDGNWTDVCCVFNSEEYEYCQALFSHLSINGNHTCFDNFYLTEVEIVDTGVKRITGDTSNGKMYDLYGRSISKPSNGITIIDGNKYLTR
ncbi:MAG: tyrosine-protein phosphatase [Bacteroidaceae bacterium]|nr:tyrosine-protein phosphatase [Bacteroidaceae bacterium]